MYTYVYSCTLVVPLSGMLLVPLSVDPKEHVVLLGMHSHQGSTAFARQHISHIVLCIGDVRST